jgi:O-antigen/teichoic acid export membrane protein
LSNEKISFASMQRIFFSNLVLAIFLNLLIKPLALFGIDATVQNRVGPEDYGLYFSLLNFSVMFNMLLDLGINNFTTKSIAQSPDEARGYFGKLMGLRLLLFVLYLVFLLLSALILGYRNQELHLLSLLALMQFLILTTGFCRSHFAGFHFFKYDALMSVLDRTLLIVFGGAILFIPQLGIEMNIQLFIWIQVVSYFIATIVALVLLWNHIDKPLLGWDLKFGKNYLRQSIPYALLVILMLVYTRTDGVMLERIHPKGAYESGIYAQGFRLLDALFMFGMIFAGLLLPLFSRQLKENKKMILEMLDSAGNLLISGAVVIVIITISNAAFILNLIYTNGLESMASFQWLMLSFLAICMNFIFGTLLTANGNMRFLNWSSAVGIGVNIILNLYLIPDYGAKGAAFTTFVTQSTVAIFQFFYCKRLFDIPINLKLIFRYGILIGLLVGANFFVHDHFNLLFIQILLSIVLLVSLSFLRIENLKSLLKGAKK